MNAILVLTTADSQDLALRIATSLVESREAACVNIIPAIRSIYRWEGKVCDERELLLVIKTSEDRFETVRARIRELHSYEIPEIVSLPVTAGDPDYLSWLQDQVGSA